MLVEECGLSVKSNEVNRLQASLFRSAHPEKLLECISGLQIALLWRLSKDVNFLGANYVTSNAT